MTNFIARDCNGAGLGDAIGQVNFIYQLAQYFKACYVITPIESATHSSRYDEILGLDSCVVEPRDSLNNRPFTGRSS